jgi:hypothetical protein
MNKQQALETLKHYNEWRRDKGDTEDLIMHEPKVIGEAIDVAIAALSEPVTLPKIDYDADMDRYYIPMPAGWEMQTKGKGSSFRLCNTKTHERFHILDERLQPVLEQMAREMHEASTAVTLPDGWVAVPVEPTEAEYLEHAVREELLLFASESDYLAIANGVWELFIKRYKAMLQVAPTDKE